MNPRPSYFLTACGLFAILAAIQVLTSWIWLDFSSPDWRVAWCDYASPRLDWFLLYSWAASGIAVAYFLLRGMRVEGYALTILSYAWFWITTFFLNRDYPNWRQDTILLLIFGGFMVWSYRRYRSRLPPAPQIENQLAEQAVSGNRR